MSEVSRGGVRKALESYYKVQQSEETLEKEKRSWAQREQRAVLELHLKIIEAVVCHLGQKMGQQHGTATPPVKRKANPLSRARVLSVFTGSGGKESLPRSQSERYEKGMDESLFTEELFKKIDRIVTDATENFRVVSEHKADCLAMKNSPVLSVLGKEQLASRPELNSRSRSSDDLRALKDDQERKKFASEKVIHANQTIMKMQSIGRQWKEHLKWGASFELLGQTYESGNRLHTLERIDEVKKRVQSELAKLNQYRASLKAVTAEDIFKSSQSPEEKKIGLLKQKNRSISVDPEQLEKSKFLHLFSVSPSELEGLARKELDPEEDLPIQELLIIRLVSRKSEEDLRFLLEKERFLTERGLSVIHIASAYGLIDVIEEMAKQGRFPASGDEAAQLEERLAELSLEAKEVSKEGIDVLTSEGISPFGFALNPFLYFDRFVMHSYFIGSIPAYHNGVTMGAQASYATARLLLREGAVPLPQDLLQAYRGRNLFSLFILLEKYPDLSVAALLKEIALNFEGEECSDFDNLFIDALFRYKTLTGQEIEALKKLEIDNPFARAIRESLLPYDSGLFKERIRQTQITDALISRESKEVAVDFVTHFANECKREGASMVLELQLEIIAIWIKYLDLEGTKMKQWELSEEIRKVVSKTLKKVDAWKEGKLTNALENHRDFFLQVIEEQRLKGSPQVTRRKGKSGSVIAMLGNEELRSRIENQFIKSEELRGDVSGIQEEWGEALTFDPILFKYYGENSASCEATDKETIRMLINHFEQLFKEQKEELSKKKPKKIRTGSVLNGLKTIKLEQLEGQIQKEGRKKLKRSLVMDTKPVLSQSIDPELVKQDELRTLVSSSIGTIEKYGGEQQQNGKRELSIVESLILCYALRREEEALEKIKEMTDFTIHLEKQVSALHLACAFGLEEVIPVLIEKGCYVDLETAQGLTPLDYAINPNYYFDQFPFDSALEDAEIDHYKAAKNGASNHSLRVVKLLIKNHATVSQETLLSVYKGANLAAAYHLLTTLPNLSAAQFLVDIATHCNRRMGTDYNDQFVHELFQLLYPLTPVDVELLRGIKVNNVVARNIIARLRPYGVVAYPVKE
ncbi:MAG: hypothetical protein KDK71_07095 [Chlamydiia bacterium]|nr:hypothetical protein [Chlamydiia bacterium]